VLPGLLEHQLLLQLHAQQYHALKVSLGLAS
jgi:hypothetical protein